MFRIATVPYGHVLHTNLDRLSEAHVFDGNKIVHIASGPLSLIKARAFITRTSLTPDADPIAPKTLAHIQFAPHIMFQLRMREQFLHPQLRLHPQLALVA